MQQLLRPRQQQHLRLRQRPQPSRQLLRPRRPSHWLVAVAAVGALVVGCGDESTASKTGPTTETTTAKASKGATTTTLSPEELKALPKGYPSIPEAPIDDKGRAFLHELKTKKVPYSDKGEQAIAIARTICQGVREGAPSALISANTLAMVSAELQSAGSDFDPQNAADIYLDAAKTKFC